MTTTKTSEAIMQMSDLFGQFQSNMANIIKNIRPEDNIIENVEPYWVNPNYTSQLMRSHMYRFNQQKMRFYFSVAELENPEIFGNIDQYNYNELVKFYPSVTTVIDKTTPMPYGLKKLLGEMGITGFNRFMRQKADYGTLLHILYADYYRSGNTKEERTFDFDTLPGRISLFIEEKHIDYDTDNWNWDLRKDLAALIKFAWDYEVEPIAVEISGLFDDGQYRFAGCIDLICHMTIPVKDFWGEVYKSGEKKGEPKETIKPVKVTAIVDLKSGKSGFFTDHEIQLHMYKLIAEQSLGLKIDKVFNVAPKDWEDEPTYSLKDQTDSREYKKIPFLLGAFYCDWEAPKDLLIINGKINGHNEMSEICRHVPAAEFLFNRVYNISRN